MNYKFAPSHKKEKTSPGTLIQTVWNKIQYPIKKKSGIESQVKITSECIPNV
jgi:hypothetical protein